MAQGTFLSENEIQRIILLLKTTELPIRDIAERMRCSRSAIAAVNRRYQIRNYSGKRSSWTCGADNFTHPFELELAQQA